jgi:Zn-finger domain-containing protein
MPKDGSDEDLQKALKRLQEADDHLTYLVENVYLMDQRQLLERVTAAIGSHRLKLGTLPYNQIATILHDISELESPNSLYAIKLPDKTIPISAIEFEVYQKPYCTDKILRNILGREQNSIGGANELLNFFFQSNIRSPLLQGN